MNRPNTDVKRNGNKGFTLIELLIVIALISIVMAGVYSIYESHLELKRTQETIVDMNQNVRSALQILKNEIRFLGYDPINTSQGVSSRAGIVSPSSGSAGNSITFTYIADDDEIDNNGDDFIDEVGELATITFALNGSSVTRDDQYTGTFPIADNIENVDFSVSTSADNSTLVRITLLVRAGKEDKKVTNTDPLTFVIPDGSGRTWSISGGDHYRRKLVSTVVKCRNT